MSIKILNLKWPSTGSTYCWIKVIHFRIISFCRWQTLHVPAHVLQHEYTESFISSSIHMYTSTCEQHLCCSLSLGWQDHWLGIRQSRDQCLNAVLLMYFCMFNINYIQLWIWRSDLESSKQFAMIPTRSSWVQPWHLVDQQDSHKNTQSMQMLDVCRSPEA